MKLLLDTHILLWWLNNDNKLPDMARLLVSDENNEVYISHISLWEIQIKVMSGKLEANMADILEALPHNEFQELPTHAKHITALVDLPAHHQDPFDRMLIAQALSESIYLVTHDKNVSLYSSKIILV